MANLIGERIQRERRRHGLSRERLAARARLSERTIRNAERGYSAPSFRTIEKISKALGLTVFLMVTGRRRKGVAG